jgi:hypothetical protein
MRGLDLRAHRVVLAAQRRKRRTSDLLPHLDRRPGIAQAIAPPCRDLPVAHGVQVGESVAELEFSAVHRDGAEGALPLGVLRFGQVLAVHGQEPAVAGVLKL